MKERPIIFTGEMVRAILAGRKTQTRRALKKQPCISLSQPVFNGREWGFYEEGRTGGPYQHLGKCPYGSPGDLLWVRENFRLHHKEDENSPGEARVGTKTWYEADDPQLVYAGKLRPSIYMPRSRTRILLTVETVSIERLQDISDADARAEGVPGMPPFERSLLSEPCPDPAEKTDLNCRMRFAALWEQINGQKSWQKNPWVWVIEFRRIKA